MKEQTNLFTLSMPPPSIMELATVRQEGNSTAWAYFSSDRKHRYLLGRTWNNKLPSLIVGMLNPSIADAYVLDPTIKRVVSFAKRDGFGSIVIWNTCSLVATNPKDLLKADDKTSHVNDAAIRHACERIGKIVLAAGKPPSRDVESIIRRSYFIASEHPVYRFGATTKDGWPRHPLYLRRDTPIVKHT